MRRRLVIAAAAGLVTAVTAWAAGLVLIDAFSCAPPAAWWPGWAWPCLGTGRDLRQITALGWDTALPLMMGVAVFLAIGLSRR